MGSGLPWVKMGSGLPLTLNNLEQGSTVDLTPFLIEQGSTVDLTPFLSDRKATGGKARVRVRTGLGKSDCPGSQGGLRKRGLW